MTTPSTTDRRQRTRYRWLHRRRKLRHVAQRLRDVRRELRYLSPDDTEAPASDDARHLEAQVMKDYHRIEKALALRAPNREFGKEPHSRLVRDVERAEHANLRTELVDAARDVLRSHDEWQHDGVRRSLEDGGVIRALQSDEFEQARLADPEAFFLTRRSIRDFDARIPPAEELARAVRLAQSTPSVCNRQGVSVNLYTEPDLVQAVLAHQRGSRGFREIVPAAFVVHVDTRLFTISSERNQRWVDGGLFAMTLALALHALGIGSCMLNWAVEHQEHDALRRHLGLPEHQDIVVLMAAGYPPDNVRAARSLRRPLDEVLSMNPPLAG